MNVLFVGKFFPKKLITNLAEDSKGKAGLSNHNFEMSIINGLCQQSDISLKCLTIPGVYSYPYNNRKLFTNAEKYNYKNTSIRSVGFCNLPIIKEIWSTLALIIQLVKSINDFDDVRVDIIINPVDNRLLNAVRWAKCLTRKQVTQTVIIPDVPSVMTRMNKQNRIKYLISNFLDKRSIRLISKSHGLVLLTEAMTDFIDKPLPYIVMEGIVDVGSMGSIYGDIETTKEIILYTGSLRKIFGINNLIDAFGLISNPDVELWLCGSGDSIRTIELAAQKDTRIKFWGLVDSQTAIKMQHQATILVNPRTSEGEYTKYSFPSKTMEYILAGKTVIINRLPGIPKEYYKFVYTPNDESSAALAECINSVLCLEKKERVYKAMSGREFIIRNKNSIVQTRRILDMIIKYDL